MSPKALPRLIILEGPAGVGKTTLSLYLKEGLIRKGIDAKTIPEFSNSPLGSLIEQNSLYGSSVPYWLTGVGGSMAFLADIMASIDLEKSDSNHVWIADRFTISQLILGLNAIGGPEEKKTMMRIIIEASDLVNTYFSKDSLLIILEAPINLLRIRLEERLNKPLSQNQLRTLKEEIEGYSSLKYSFHSWKVININATNNVKIVGNNIIDLILKRWQL